MTAPTEESNCWDGPPKLLTLSDEAIKHLFDNTDFGVSGETPEGRRGLMVECVLKRAAGYSAGSTICHICQKVGLVDDRYKATPLGSRWALTQIYQSGHDERVHEEYKRRFPEQKSDLALEGTHGYEFACGCVVTDGARSHCNKHGTALMHGQPDYPEGADGDIVRRF